MFPRSLSDDNLIPQADEAIKIRKLMTIIAWVCLVIGVILSLVTLGNYSDKNLVLMIGIGFLVASVHIYVIGLFMALMFRTPPEHEHELEPSPKLEGAN